MNTTPVLWLAGAGILAAILAFFFGGLAIVVALVLFGFAIIVLAGELEGLGKPAPKEPPHPLRYACPGCGGDVYMGQAVCRNCGHSLIAAQTSSR